MKLINFVPHNKKTFFGVCMNNHAIPFRLLVDTIGIDHSGLMLSLISKIRIGL
jgi:hypothetical protein